MSAAGYEPKDGKIVADDKWHGALAPGDNKRWPTGTYSLKIVDATFAIGVFFSRKDPDNKNRWHSKSKDNLTFEERQRIAEQIKAHEKTKAAAEEKHKRRIAARLTSAVNALPKATEHPYLTKKGVKAHGLRLRKKGNELILPLYGANGKVWTLQRILADGSKYLWKGGRKRGGYYPLAERDEDKSVILICEGFATGASLREATGLPVIVAIDSGNLKAVVEMLAKKYPDSRLVICADNDAFTLNAKKEKWNVGICKADEAAKLHNAEVVAPSFEDSDAYREHKWTDFNDLHKVAGIGEVAAQIKNFLKGIPAKAGEAAASDQGKLSGNLDQHTGGGDVSVPHDWQGDMIYDGHGRAVKSSLKNKILLLANHPNYKDVFRYNDFAHKIMVVRCPPWETEDTFKIHVINDIDITQTTAFLEDQGLSPERGGTHNAIDTVAHNNHFHPAQEYFKSLVWDKKPRLDTWLKDYLGAEDDEDAYLAFIGRKWLTAAVKRIFVPGCKFDHVLVMEGEQGRGKSTALKELSTFGDEVQESYFTDAITIADIQNKDTIQKIQGSIIVELAELAGFNKRDDEEIKRWITLQHDDCRLPYERTTTRFSRQFVLSATTNSYDYLKDPTGNRRYWPVKTELIDMDAIKRDRKQLWAEAYELYKSGLYIGPTPEEMALATVAQEKRRTVDVWEYDVLHTIKKLEEYNRPMRLDEIMKEMGMALRERDWRSQSRLVSILKANGFESTVGKSDGKSVRHWKKLKADKKEEPAQQDLYGEEIKF
jgi:putative DNA primase/helicase